MELTDRVLVLLAVAGQAPPVSIARGEDPQAASNAAPAAEAGEPGKQRLGADPELLQGPVKLACLLGRTAGLVPAEHGRGRDLDQRRQRRQIRAGVFPDRGSGVGRQHQDGHGHPDDGTDRRFFQPKH